MSLSSIENLRTRLGAKPWWLLATGLTLLALILIVPLPSSLERSQIIGALVNVAHGPLFAFIAFITAWFLNQTTQRGCMLVFLGLLALATVGEAIQVVSDRSVSWRDLSSNLLGVTLGFTFWLSFFPNDIVHRKTTRVLSISLCCICVGLLAVPFINSMSMLMERKIRFPVIFDAEFRSVTTLTESLGELHEVELRQSASGLDVRLLSGIRPGLVFWRFPGDWRDYTNLIIELENLSTTPLFIGIHIRDRTGTAIEQDRYNAQSTLTPGELQTLRYSLQDIEQSPMQRVLDLSDISLIAIFRAQGDADRFRVRAIRLE